jgi:hypothetical protein
MCCIGVNHMKTTFYVKNTGNNETGEPAINAVVTFADDLTFHNFFDGENGDRVKELIAELYHVSYLDVYREEEVPTEEPEDFVNCDVEDA